MTRAECPQVALVEALHDGRLGPQEHASLTRHLGLCAECAAAARDLDRIRDVVNEPIQPATPLEHQRARLALQRRAATLPGSPARRPRALVMMMAAALMLTTVVGWAGGRLTAPPERARIAERPRELQARLVTTVGPSQGARFERVREAGVDTVTLANGALDVSARAPAFRERFLVRTTDAEIEGSGTTFHVEADQGRIRGVSVVTGSVEVRYGGFTAVIPAGGSWRATGEPPAPVAPTAATPLPAPPVAEPPKVSAPPPVRVAARAERAARPAPQPTAVEKPEPAPAAQPEPPTASLASREFAEAMKTLRQGDYDQGAARLRQFAADHPNDARADEADYVRALALHRAGKTADAAAAARRYLETRPSGAHRSAAQTIAAK